MPTNKLTWFILLTAYFVSRLFHLTLLPMFLDEATHLKWAIDIVEKGQFTGSFTGRYIPIWGLSLLIPYTPPHHLLLTIRLISVGVGLLGLLGCYLLGAQLFRREVGFIAAILYLVVPYTLFYDRMGLVDNLLTVEAIYIVWFSYRLCHKPTLADSFGLGFVLGTAFSTKLNGIMLVALPVVVVVSQFSKSDRYFLPAVWRLHLLGYGISLGGFIPHLLDITSFKILWAEFSDKMWVEQQQISLSMIWLINGRDTLLYLAQNLSPMVFLMACLGIGLALKRRQRNELLLLGAASITLSIFIFFGKPNGWYPRYLLPAVPFLLLTVAHTIWVITEFIASKPKRFLKHGSVVFLLFIIAPALWFDYWLWIDPPRAPFVATDRWQYISGKHAGYGLMEAIDYLHDQPNPFILVYDNSLDTFMPVLWYDQRPRVLHVGLKFNESARNILVKEISTLTKPTFIITSDKADEKFVTEISAIKPIARFMRPGDLTSVNLYQVIK